VLATIKGPLTSTIVSRIDSSRESQDANYIEIIQTVDVVHSKENQ